MVFKLAREAERTCRRLNGHELVENTISGVRFEEGMEVREAAYMHIPRAALAQLPSTTFDSTSVAGGRQRQRTSTSTRRTANGSCRVSVTDAS